MSVLPQQGGIQTPLSQPLTNNQMLSASRRRIKRTELGEDQKLEIKEAFELFDTEKTGYIGFYELKVCLKAFGFDVTKTDILDLKKQYDQKQTGRINFTDFSDILANYICERDPIVEIRKAFHLFDEDNTGHISLKNLKRVARELDENLNDDELQAMIDEFDLDGDGKKYVLCIDTVLVNESEFIALMTQSAFL